MLYDCGRMVCPLRRISSVCLYLSPLQYVYIQSVQVIKVVLSISSSKYKNFAAGDLKKDKIDDAIERMEKLRAAVNEFGRFQQMMRTRNRYDFDDMSNWVSKAVEENKNLLANYQEKYQYILVEEYQDTSGTQIRLVELLIS